MHEHLIQQIIKEAKTPLTTLVKTLGLQPEQGVTDISLNNLEKILNSDYEIKKVVFYFKKNDPRLHTEWVSKDGEALAWDFRGFNAGYRGEGPNGLLTALKMLDIKGWNFEKLDKLESPNRYKML